MPVTIKNTIDKNKDNIIISNYNNIIERLLSVIYSSDLDLNFMEQEILEEIKEDWEQLNNFYN